MMLAVTLNTGGGWPQPGGPRSSPDLSNSVGSPRAAASRKAARR